jgi:hypothetical protein
MRMWRFVRAGAVSIAAAMAVAFLSTAVWAQIPERWTWEITFDQVEAAAGLSDMRTTRPETFEARLMQRAWSAVAPVPFLRLFRSDGTIRAQLFVFWAPRYMSPAHRPQGPDIACRDGVCVRPFDINVERDWRELVIDLANNDACPPRDSGSLVICGDCDQLWIKTVANGKYREQSCQVPPPDTLAASLLEFMKKARAFTY